MSKFCTYICIYRHMYTNINILWTNAIEKKIEIIIIKRLFQYLKYCIELSKYLTPQQEIRLIKTIMKVIWKECMSVDNGPNYLSNTKICFHRKRIHLPISTRMYLTFPLSSLLIYRVKFLSCKVRDYVNFFKTILLLVPWL